MVFCCQCWDGMRYEEGQANTSHRIFTLAELMEATKSFDQSSKIGEGGSCSVYMGMIKKLEHPFSNIEVAVKQIKKGQMGRRQWEAEVMFLKKIKHQNLLKLVGYCNEDSRTERNWFLVYEYLPNRSLDHHLSTLPWAMRLIIAKDTATGLAYLHEAGVTFKDFKPSNVLLDNQMNAKLSYFGFAREAPKDAGQTNVATSMVGTNSTKGYVAPEYVEKKRLTSKMDVWSYGAFLQELITGGFPIAKENPDSNPECMRWVCCYAGAEKTKLIVDPRLEEKYSEKSMQKVASIAYKCLVMEPKKRPKMTEVLKLVKEAISLERLNPDLTIQVC